MESGKASFPMSRKRKHRPPRSRRQSKLGRSPGKQFCRMDPPAWMILPIAREKQKTALATREPPGSRATDPYSRTH